MLLAVEEAYRPRHPSPSYRRRVQPRAAIPPNTLVKLLAEDPLVSALIQELCERHAVKVEREYHTGPSYGALMPRLASNETLKR